MLLLLTAAMLAAPSEDRPSLPAPQLRKGDELIFVGSVVEANERAGHRLRKHHELEVRLFVLEVDQGQADCALMTVLRTPPDPELVQEAVLSGTKSAPTIPTVQIELIRVDARGRMTQLKPAAGPPPIPLDQRTATANLPGNPIDRPPWLEYGFFVPLPSKLVSVGESWATAEPGQPPVVWKIPGARIWNGLRCLEVEAMQQTDGWDQPSTSFTGWKRSETILVAPANGFASTVHRRIERREGSQVVGWVETKYALQPPARHVGQRYIDVRHEIEMAYGYGSEVSALLEQTEAVDPQAFHIRRLKLERHLEDRFIVPTGFRVAVEALRRRCEAAAVGKLVKVAIPTVMSRPSASPLSLGKPAPDFVAPLVDSARQFRLSAARGSPVLLAFYKPGAETAAGTLGVLEQLASHFDSKLTVAALTVDQGFDQARQEQSKHKLTLPIADGTGLRAHYDIQYYPQFFLIDAQGILVWQFEGFGGELGYLAKKEVKKVLK
jgi:peroxiredoxin